MTTNEKPVTITVTMLLSIVGTLFSVIIVLLVFIGSGVIESVNENKEAIGELKYEVLRMRTELDIRSTDVHSPREPRP